MRTWFVFVATMVLALSALVASASAHDGVHADDFTRGVEVTPPSGVEAKEPPVTARAFVGGPRKVAVLLLNFTDNRSEPWTQDDIRSVIFTGAASVNAFEQEQSFGALSLTGKVRADGDVFGWYQLNVGSATCDPDTWMAVANALATAQGVDLSGYQHYIYMFPSVPACGWAGAADMPGTVNFINGTTSVRVISHELGHNLGAHHASAYNCQSGGVRVTFSTSCTFSEYGDPFDVMGYTDRQSAAFRKVGYGFLSGAQTQTVTQTGTYTVSSASDGGPGIRSLRVPRGPGDYWYLETRSTAGQYDDYFPLDPAVTGVTIRRAGDYGVGVRTLLIDANPGTPSFVDAPFGPGMTFTDPVTNIAIAVQSATGGVATVNVTIPGTTVVPPPSTPPPPGTTPPPTGATTPSPVPPAAKISVRRITRGKVSVRLITDVAATAKTCAMRAGILRWRSCAMSAGHVAVTRIAPVTKSTVNVMLLIDGKLVVSKRVRVPALGKTVRVTTSQLG